MTNQQAYAYMELLDIQVVLPQVVKLKKRNALLCEFVFIQKRKAKAIYV